MGKRSHWVRGAALSHLNGYGMYRVAEAMAHDNHDPATTLKTPDGTMTDSADPDAVHRHIRECLEELASILKDTSKTNDQDGRHE